MKYMDCFKFLARRRKDQLVITSAGNSAQAWLAVTGDGHGTFYLEASMSLSSMFGLGLALARPELRVWAFMGDGAFCMNAGAVMVERQMNAPNLTHFVVSNRHYGATHNAPVPNLRDNDYGAIARGMGVERVFTFDTLDGLERGFDAAAGENVREYTFVVLEVEPMPLDQRPAHPPFDGPDLKYRFGRRVERLSGCSIFDYPA
jgi:sulfopyruvate decarboxylase subunit beta